MDGKYRIGRHEFASKKEWEKALKDLKKIKTIVDQTDIENPKETLFIYNLIRDGKITFSSELGAAFFCDISDRVAENSKKLLDISKKKKNGGSQRKDNVKSSKKPFIYKILGIVCVLIAILSLACYCIVQYNEIKATRRLEEVKSEKSISQAVDWYMTRVAAKQEDTKTLEADAAGIEAKASEPPKVPEPPKILPEYEALKGQYPDLAGWLRIESTQIDLPVMQASDNEKYLDRNIDGAEDINGTLFLDCRDDYQNQSTNLIIYGHNMKSGAMFGGLKQYLESSYVPGHDKIQFDTIYEKQTYQVIAVCLSEVGYQDDGKFRYYDFIQSGSSEEFNVFLESVRECAVYDNTQDVAESDKLLTLSTCSSYVEDGRLFVVAKKIQ